MRGLKAIVLAALFAFVLFVPAFRAQTPEKPVTVIPADRSWAPNPTSPEVQTSVAWGEMDKGPHGAFHKFPAGFVAPLHTHTADLRAVVIRGVMSIAGEDGTATKLPPGSYFFEPALWKHVTKCELPAECVIFVVASGKFDLNPVAVAPKE